MSMHVTKCQKMQLTIFPIRNAELKKFLVARCILHKTVGKLYRS